MQFQIAGSPLRPWDDALYRLTAADYDDGTFFHYTYDAVGNRLTEETDEGTSNYTYDIANRLTNVDGVAYTWDANGNLLSDGTSTYTYDAANRLVGLVQGDDTYAYTYNGLGDRLSQTINGETTNYTLDIDTYLTQVLADGTNTYLYGQTRIGEEQPEGWQVHLADALGSVRQLADAENAITLAQSYTPYGETLYSEGEGETAYEYTGQIRDASGLTYLRARYLNSSVGRFISRDPSGLEENLYLYAGGNPILYVDPSGYISISENDNAFDIINDLFDIYGIYIEKDWGWFSYEDLLSPSFVLTPDAVTCTWRKGNWKDIGELRIVEEAIDLVASGLGGPDKFRMAMGSSVRISRWDLSAGSFAPPGILKSLGDVVLSNDTFDSSDMYAQYTIIHELGHVWDYNTGKQLSKGLMNALQTWICNEGGECRWYPFAGHIDPVTLETISEPPPGSDRNCWGPHCDVIPYAATYGWGSRDHPLQKIFAYYGWWPGIEDWADTFAEYIYPDYHSWRERTRLELGGVREAYVKKAIESIQ